MASSPLMAHCNISAHEVAVPPQRGHPSHGCGHLDRNCGFNRALPITSNRWFARSIPERRSAPLPEDRQIFVNYMAGKARQINEALESAVPSGHSLRIHESMRYTLLGNGKRVAGMLCLASCVVVGGDESRAMTAACALEMLHAMSLIHDDLPCMDNDDLRRGKPTNHRAFDEVTALLAGDALVSLAFEHMAGMEDVPPCQVLRAVTELGHAAGPEGIPGGQLMDKVSEGRNDFSLSELEYIHTHKANIMRATTVCGGIIGGGDEDEIERMRVIGTKLGLLYQAVDDVLDVTGSSEELGKKTGRDLAKDKATFVKLMGIEGTKKYTNELLDDILQELSCFDDERAGPLRQLASFFVSRRK